MNESGDIIVSPEEALARRMAGEFFELDGEARVRELRETVLGRQPMRLVGLAGVLDRHLEGV